MDTLTRIFRYFGVGTESIIPTGIDSHLNETATGPGWRVTGDVASF